MFPDNPQILVSVIVPIYKVEIYLRRCIESILGQTYSNIEVILVDDGSPDNCGAICDEYAQKDSRVTVIHKKNGGLADARNVGLKHATGQYITLIDSDDFVTEDYVEVLLNLCIRYKAEISVTDFQNYKSDRDLLIPEIKREDFVFNNITALKHMLYQKYFDVSAWAKMYHRDLFSGIEYSVELFNEDLATTYKLMLKANNVAFTNAKCYYYLLRTDSITGIFNPKKMDIITLFSIMFRDLAVCDSSLLLPAKCRMVSGYFNLFFQMEKDDPNALILWKEIKKYRSVVLSDPEGRKKAKIACFVSFFGINALRRFYSFIDKRK